jgi:hypothetical protein
MQPLCKCACQRAKRTPLTRRTAVRLEQVLFVDDGAEAEAVAQAGREEGVGGLGAGEGVGLRPPAKKVKFTGLTQNLQVDPAVLTENPYKSLRVDPDSGSTL